MPTPNNMSSSPFSGVSLIVHLLIIGGAKVLHLFGYKKTTVRKESGKFKKAGKILLANLIILLAVGVMSTSFVVAVRTGYREGKNEPQRELAVKGFSFAKDWLNSKMKSEDLKLGYSYEQFLPTWPKELQK